MKKIVIVDGIRTPFVKSWTLFDAMSAQQLGALCVRELIERTGIKPGLVDEVIIGCVGQPIDAANVARVVSLLAGIPKDKRAYTVHRNCASGFEAVTSAAEKIQLGVDEIVIAGGTESMSHAPLNFSKESAAIFMELGRAKTFPQKLSVLSKFRLKHFQPVAALQLALTDPVCGLNMGQTAEVLVKKWGIRRAEQDEFALESHQKVMAARERLREEMMKVFVPPDYKKVVYDDTGVREGQTMEALAKLKPVFEKRSGSVTAGNSSQITDGACALLVMDEAKAKSLGYEVLGTVRDYLYVGVEPSEMGIGPAYAIGGVLKRNQLRLKDIQLFEINEAFAAQVLSCLKALACPKFAEENFGMKEAFGEIPRDRLNVNGGAIALGHPVGVSGARLILTCLKEMKRRGYARGLVSLCVGGGQGGVVLLERNL
ncbi:MAG: acetyl-CoA acyltransferase [Omnitrophica bacterium GWA2_52_8]|nr:MAG: acetyl-CoA acyltransferase [Omnitrophica bacterium GWA2_52_8]